MSTTSATAAASALPLYAGFWRRVAAYSIDSTVLVLPAALILFTLSFNEYLATLGVFVVMVLVVGYFVLMHSSALQATIGKLFLGVNATASGIAIA